MTRWTSMPVHAADDGITPERGHVYLANPDHVLTLEGGVLRSRPADAGSRRPAIDTIDAFFESLAADRGRRAVGVVLSGTGSDGTAGSRRIKEAGGTVLVQDPLTAAHEGMPRAAIAGNVADYILSVDRMASQIVLCASPSHVPPDTPVDSTGEIAAILEEIGELLRAQRGFELAGRKAPPLLWRIQQRMDLRLATTFEDYIALLRDDPGEVEELIRGFAVHVTEFFRDPEAWEVLSRDVLAPLVAAPVEGRPIRAWTQACASGEEAYSVAMLLAEQAEAASAPVDFQIFATDASHEILARASRGVFSEKAIRGVSPERRARFFYAADGAWRVKRSLREKMVFAPHDMLSDPPFSGLDLVTCRNLLIYLDGDAAKRVISQLHRCLRPGGCLFLGRSEMLTRVHRGFEAVSPRWHIYRKVDAASALETRHAAAAAPSLPIDDESTEPAHVAWREAVRISHEELEASREELQVLNEELRASNEQLNVSNDELQAKVAELEMQHRVLSSGAVMTLFLDEELRVRWFTPAVSEIFPLVPHDVGRPIVDFVQRLDDETFEDDVRRVMQAGPPLEAELRSPDGRWFLRRIHPYLSETAEAKGAAITFTDITRRKAAEDALRESQAWLAGQKEAFQAAMYGAPLEASLGILIRTAVEQMGDGVRCGVYLADPGGTELFHVTGMPDAYRRCVDGFKIGPDSLACGLAVYTGRPVITPDVTVEPLWKDWLWLAKDFEFRGCWSFPVETSEGKVVGTFAMYHEEPRTPTARDLELGDMLARAAAIIISRHQD
jgi:chemotaxis methyl-accepting protein methylase